MKGAAQLAEWQTVDGTWMRVKDADPRARAIFDRHYSRKRYRDGRTPKLFVGPGEKMVLMTVGEDALFVWRRFLDNTGQTGVCCAVFRNEGRRLSSELVLAAERLAWARWPGERLYTWVNPKRIRSCNPGCCFKKAGWIHTGVRSKDKGLVLLVKTATHSATTSRTDRRSRGHAAMPPQPPAQLSGVSSSNARASLFPPALSALRDERSECDG